VVEHGERMARNLSVYNSAYIHGQRAKKWTDIRFLTIDYIAKRFFKCCRFNNVKLLRRESGGMPVTNYVHGLSFKVEVAHPIEYVSDNIASPTYPNVEIGLVVIV
jgi:hypothetical protein